MQPAPWITINRPDPQREYLALLSNLPLRRHSSIPRFMLYSLQTMRQLKHTPGMMGYSLWAELIKKEFWTLSAWESEQALREFVRANPHGKVMQKLEGKMEPTGFWRWQVRGDQLPLKWHESLERRRSTG